MKTESEKIQFPRLSLKKILGLSSIYGITPILDRALSLLLLPIFTHYLSTDRYGSLVLLYASANLIYLLVFMGVPETLSKIYWDHKGEDRKKCLGTAWITTLVLNLIIGIPLVAFSKGIAISFFQNSSISILFILIIVRITLSTQSIIPIIVFRAREQKFHVLSANLLSIFVRVGLTALFLIYLRLDLLGVLLADICANIATLFVYIPTLMKQITFSFRWHYLKEILTLSPFQFIVEVLAWIISLSDRLIIQHILRDLSGVGVYAVGYTFGSAILFIISPVYAAWRPYIYSVNSKSELEYRKQMGEFLKYYVIICLIAFLLISSLSPDVIRILTPPPYHAAGSLVTIVLLGHIFAVLSNYFVTNFFLAGRMQLIAFVYLISAIINVSLNYVLIPVYGIYGAAWATLIAYGIMLIMIFWISQRVRRINIEVRPISVIVFITIGIWALISIVGFENPFISIAIKGCVLIPFLVIPLLLYQRNIEKQSII